MHTAMKQSSSNVPTLRASCSASSSFDGAVLSDESVDGADDYNNDRKGSAGSIASGPRRWSSAGMIDLDQFNKKTQIGVGRRPSIDEDDTSPAVGVSSPSEQKSTHSEDTNDEYSTEDEKSAAPPVDEEILRYIPADLRHLPIMDLKMFTIDEVEPLGCGKAGFVLQATHIETKEEFAVKRISRTLHNSRKWFLNESMITQLNLHENTGIIKQVGISADKEYYYLFMELGSTDLLARILSVGKGYGLKELRAKTLTRKLLETMVYLHNRDIVHRDLKPENIVFVKEGGDPYQPKLIDFSDHLNVNNDDTYSNGTAGTWVYRSPERWNESCSGSELKKSDIWAIGVILYETLTGAQCFSGKTVETISENVKQGHWKFPAGRQKTISNECQALVRDLLCIDPNKRPTAKDALNYDWLK